MPLCMGDSVDLSGHFLTDARVLGNTVDLTGTFEGEVSAAGRHVDIAATVAGVVNAAGETVSAAGSFADTVNLHARKVLLLPDARFDKDVNVSAEEFSTAGNVVIAGKLNKIIGKEYAREKERKGAAGCWVFALFWLVGPLRNHHRRPGPPGALSRLRRENDRNGVSPSAA